MNKQFTSGPWEVSNETRAGDNGETIGTFRIRQQGFEHTDSNTKKIIADVPPYGDSINSFNRVEVSMWDAKLIVEAPAMFELLEGIAHCGVIRIEEIKQLLTKITTP